MTVEIATQDIFRDIARQLAKSFENQISFVYQCQIEESRISITSPKTNYYIIPFYDNNSNTFKIGLFTKANYQKNSVPETKLVCDYDQNNWMNKIHVFLKHRAIMFSKQYSFGKKRAKIELPEWTDKFAEGIEEKKNNISIHAESVTTKKKITKKKTTKKKTTKEVVKKQETKEMEIANDV